MPAHTEYTEAAHPNLGLELYFRATEAISAVYVLFSARELVDRPMDVNAIVAVAGGAAVGALCHVVANALKPEQ